VNEKSSTFFCAGGAALTSHREDWRTPPDLFAALNAEFGFTLDAAANAANHLCERYYTAEDSAFGHSWKGERVFCNPPYGRDSGRWIAKFAEAVHEGAQVIVALLPARTDTRAFHDYLYQKPGVELRFLRGRLRFGHPDTGVPMNPAPFPSMIAIFRNTQSTTSQGDTTPCDARRAGRCANYEFDGPAARVYAETLDNAGRSVRPMRRFAQ